MEERERLSCLPWDHLSKSGRAGNWVLRVGSRIWTLPKKRREKQYSIVGNEKTYFQIHLVEILESSQKIALVLSFFLRCWRLRNVEGWSIFSKNSISVLSHPKNILNTMYLNLLGECPQKSMFCTFLGMNYLSCLSYMSSELSELIYIYIYLYYQ